MVYLDPPSNFSYEMGRTWATVQIASQDFFVQTGGVVPPISSIYSWDFPWNKLNKPSIWAYPQDYGNLHIFVDLWIDFPCGISCSLRIISPVLFVAMFLIPIPHWTIVDPVVSKATNSKSPSMLPQIWRWRIRRWAPSWRNSRALGGWPLVGSMEHHIAAPWILWEMLGLWHYHKVFGYLWLAMLHMLQLESMLEVHGLTCCEETMDHCMRSTRVGQQTCFSRIPQLNYKMLNYVWVEARHLTIMVMTNRLTKSYWKWLCIVDLPIKNGGSFHCFLYVYQRV